MFKEGDKSFLKFPAISREQSTGDRINAKRSVKCVHPVTFLARKIVDEASSQLRGNKVAREKGTGLRYRLIYNLQFLFFRCLHFTRRSSSPSPSLSLSLSTLFTILSPPEALFPLCSQLWRQTTRQKIKKLEPVPRYERYKCLFSSSNRHPFLFSASKTLRLRSERRRREERVVPDVQMISIITKTLTNQIEHAKSMRIDTISISTRIPWIPSFHVLHCWFMDSFFFFLGAKEW